MSALISNGLQLPVKTLPSVHSKLVTTSEGPEIMCAEAVPTAHLFRQHVCDLGHPQLLLLLLLWGCGLASPAQFSLRPLRLKART